MKVNAEEIKIIAQLVYDLCGIVLDESKGYLIESRLATLAKEHECETFSEFYYKARYDHNKAIQSDIINAITTNETLFFRDTSPFEALQHKVIPDVIDQRANSLNPKRLRIWSAACSTGQEPYSIAMTLCDLIPDIASWDIKITATDISDNALKQASQGVYADHEIKRGMKPAQLQKYFAQEGSTFKVKDELRYFIAFKRLNLHEPFDTLEQFDCVFCRNVAIYFNAQDRADLFERITRQMNPWGYLFVGSSENLTGLGQQYQPEHHCNAVVYRVHRGAFSTAST